MNQYSEWSGHGSRYWRRFGVASAVDLLLVASFAGFVLGFRDRSYLLLVAGSGFYALVGLTIVAMFRVKTLLPFVLTLSGTAVMLRIGAILPSVRLIEPSAVFRLALEQAVVSIVSGTAAFMLSGAFWKSQETTARERTRVSTDR